MSWWRPTTCNPRRTSFGGMLQPKLSLNRCVYVSLSLSLSCCRCCCCCRCCLCLLLQCIVGEYFNLTCTPCPVGFYCDSIFTPTPCEDPNYYCPGGTSVPLGVPLGSYALPEGGPRFAAVSVCDAGSVCKDGERRACAMGTYGAPGASSCADCVSWVLIVWFLALLLVNPPPPVRLCVSAGRQVRRLCRLGLVHLLRFVFGRVLLPRRVGVCHGCSLRRARRVLCRGVAHALECAHWTLLHPQ